jgi:hypothetical protein
MKHVGSQCHLQLRYRLNVNKRAVPHFRGFAGFLLYYFNFAGRFSEAAIGEAALKKISVMHVIKLGFAPVSFPPG